MKNLGSAIFASRHTYVGLRRRKRCFSTADYLSSGAFSRFLMRYAPPKAASNAMPLPMGV